MLTRLGDNYAGYDASGAAIAICDADFPAPFKSGLEYAAPTRGTWNIVHTGMLVPQAHEIFVCAAGCLRGVVLTAAEMGAMGRFSTIEIRENNVLEGDMDELILDGVGDILSRLEKRPPAVLLYTSCIHHFMGIDLKRIYRELRKRYPDVDFTDCYMNPIMRKSGLTPDQLMRRQLYSLLKPCEHDGGVSIIGNDFALDDDSMLKQIIRSSGRAMREIQSYDTYHDYQRMAASSICISTIPAAHAAGEALNLRLGQKHMYLPQSYDYDTLCNNAHMLSSALDAPEYDVDASCAQALDALRSVKQLSGDTPVALDSTLTARPLELAKLLTEQGLTIKSIYLDSISGEERAAFDWLKCNAPDIMLHPTVHAKMRLMPRRHEGDLLALGQKAAYFTCANHFVNVVEDGGMYGYEGVKRLATLMIEAMSLTRDARDYVQAKGLGCACCI